MHRYTTFSYKPEEEFSVPRQERRSPVSEGGVLGLVHADEEVVLGSVWVVFWIDDGRSEISHRLTPPRPLVAIQLAILPPQRRPL